MEYFLERIAKSLCSEYGNRLDRHCLVFPNRRAGLFLLKYLAAEIEKPVWAPAILTINDLFRSISVLQPAENEILLFELFKVYRKIRKSGESFDDFYFWGDMLLNDFDDIDKYLADASKIFRNVQELKKIDEEFGGLTKEQAEIIQRFWTNVNPEKLTKEKSEFINVWSILNDLYIEFRTSLKEKNLAYEGMIFRDVVENHNLDDLTSVRWDIVHFIGFNAMNKCEKAVMLRLKKGGRARFYWDYDNSYISGSKLNSAGYFLRDNISLFGNDMPEDWSYDTFLSRNPGSVRRRIIETSSDVAQVKLLTDLINELPDLTTENAHQTAVILADENLLIPVLTSLPENIPDINITMGYPLRYTSVCSFVRHLLDMQRRSRIENGVIMFNCQDVINVIQDNLVSELLNEAGSEIIKEIVEKNLFWISSARLDRSDYLSLIFRKASSPVRLSGYLKEILTHIGSNDKGGGDDSAGASARRGIRNEFIYRIILSLNRLDTITGSPDIDITVDTWSRILDRLLKLQSVPFSGEPLSGIQIMGILETRTLDFKNLIILSVNESVLPAASASASFIPFTLREAFGLPSINHQESIYAYHFYRLLHRAEDVTFLYNSDSEGLRSGEISRFLQQMKYDPSLNPEFQNLSFEIKNQSSIGTSIERTGEHNLRLISRFSGDISGKKKYISPSAINTWLNCRMKFYYRYVNDLEEKERITEEIDPAKLGTLLHSAVKNLYEGFCGKVLGAGVIDEILTDKHNIATLIINTIRENFKRENDSVVAVNELIIRDVLMVFIERILQMDKITAPLTIVSFEDPVFFPVSMQSEVNYLKLLVGGKIDRVDIKDGTTRIIDYKTGRIADTIDSLAALFEEDRDKELDGWLQTLLYCEAYLTKVPGVSVIPALYKLKKTQGDQLSAMLRIMDGLIVEDYKDVRQEFLEYLLTVINVIFSAGEPFVMTKDVWNKCRYCPFRQLCER
jgi:CRISPR/Cas system-associated exonuclease Cas4 (RecB family)